MRSRPLFALSLVCLASAASLGGVLVYDGAVSELAAAQPGDHVRVQAEIHSIGIVEGLYQYVLSADASETVIGQSTQWIPEGTWVLDTTVVSHTDELIQLHIESWREPVIEA